MRHTNTKKLGCCDECFTGINRMTRKNNATTLPPKYAICNGLMIGRAPKPLTDLNQVETALISLSRTEKHIFSFSGGSHKSIRGWHTLYQNDVSYMNRVMNYFDETQSDSSNADMSIEDSDGSSSSMSYDSNSEINTSSDAGNIEEKKPYIAVILTGPFTRQQVAMTRKKTNVRPRKIKKALLWLKKNNIL